MRFGAGAATPSGPFRFERVGLRGAGMAGEIRGGEISSTRGVRKVTSARGAQGFSAAKRQNFLDALAATCNITKAAAFAQVTLSTVYRARTRDPVFAEHWREAMAIGFDRLEALVLEHGGAGGPIEIDPDRAERLADGLAPFDFERAMTVLKYAMAARDGVPNRRTGRPRVDATREETNAALLKALDAVRKRAVRKQSDKAARDLSAETAHGCAAREGGRD